MRDTNNVSGIDTDDNTSILISTYKELLLYVCMYVLPYANFYFIIQL